MEATKWHPFFTRRKKRISKKLAQIGSTQLILTIQTPFGRAWIALQHLLERSYSVEQFLCYTSSSLVKNKRAKLLFTMGSHHVNSSRYCHRSWLLQHRIKAGSQYWRKALRRVALNFANRANKWLRRNFLIWRMNATWGNAGIGSESILAFRCVAASVNACRRNATQGLASYCEPAFRSGSVFVTASLKAWDVPLSKGSLAALDTSLSQ